MVPNHHSHLHLSIPQDGGISITQFLQKNVHQDLKGLVRPVSGGAEGGKEVMGASKGNGGASRTQEHATARQIIAGHGVIP